MFMHKSKKGFTIVELVIVIAVIAILAAVLIPTFSNLVKKANQSADIQAARQMNTVLAAEGAVKAPNIFELFDALAANGMSAKDYKPLTTDHYFFWDDDANRIVYTDKNYQVIFPTDFQKQGNWLSLTQKIAATKPANYSAANTTVTVKSGEELVYVLEEIESGACSGVVSITIPADGVDMKGAAFSVGELDKDVTKVVITGGPIKNATAVKIADADGKNYAGVVGEDQTNGLYGCSLFGIVNPGQTLEIRDVTFENLNVKNTDASGAAILVGAVYSDSTKEGKVIIDGVTINNCTVIGHRSVGALVGIMQGKLELSGEIELNNVNVLTVGGRAGLLFGQNGTTDKNGNVVPNCSFTNTATITATNCTLDIYKCEQNTGTKTIGAETVTLVNSGSKITSYCKVFDKNGNMTEQFKKDYAFNANAIQGMGAFTAPTVAGW